MTESEKLKAARQCDGSCETHSGEVKPVSVIGHSQKHIFNYCDTAIDCDRKNGFDVTVLIPQTDFTKQIQVDKFDAQMYINTLESDIAIWGQLSSDGAKARVQITQQHLDSAKKLLGL